MQIILTNCSFCLSRKVIFEKQWIFLDNAVGQLYSTTFEILSGGNLKPHELKDTASPLGV